MKKLRSLWKDFLKKGFAILTIFMMLGQLGQGAITAFANELAVGDNGALDVTLMYGDKQDHPGGMSYYTGTIFEIAIPEFGGSCGGGGRYDKMVGKFTGHDVPACGFSIGFERIVLLLMEQGFKIPEDYDKVVYLIEKGVSGDALCDVIANAQEERKSGKQVLVTRMNKNKKFQKEQLMAQGYNEFKEFYKNPLK